MSDVVGYVLLASSGASALMGWDLSRRGLQKIETAATEANQVAAQASQAVQASQPVLAQATGAEADRVAQANTALAAQTADLAGAVTGVEDALKGLTGAFAPARVFLAITLLLLLAAFVALDLISVAVADDAASVIAN
jgi:hypothetical protein